MRLGKCSKPLVLLIVGIVCCLRALFRVQQYLLQFHNEDDIPSEVVSTLPSQHTTPHNTFTLNVDEFSIPNNTNNKYLSVIGKRKSRHNITSSHKKHDRHKNNNDNYHHHNRQHMPKALQIPKNPLLELLLNSSLSAVSNDTNSKTNNNNNNNKNITLILQEMQKSTVDYFACCGIGHRLSKMVDANYLANFLNFGLRVHWGFCDSQDVFSFLFGNHNLRNTSLVTSTNKVVRINNEVPGFQKITRIANDNYTKTTKDQCPCSTSYMQQSISFFTNLRNSFVSQTPKVDDFMQQHMFANHTMIGVHIRAGNGEEGDFMKRNRGINDTSIWVQSMSNVLLSISRQFATHHQHKPPKLFIATDTPSLIKQFRHLLNDTMSVIDYQQSRPKEGQGVLFGQAENVLQAGGSKCLQSWQDALMDMMLLSHANIIVAARPSSFTQSLPMSVAYGKPNQSYCEVNSDGTNYRCYQEFESWCCQGQTSFSQTNEMKKYDFLRMPKENFAKTKVRIVDRPNYKQMPIPNSVRNKDTYLPYDWSDPRGNNLFL